MCLESCQPPCVYSGVWQSWVVECLVKSGVSCLKSPMFSLLCYLLRALAGWYRGGYAQEAYAQEAYAQDA